MFFFNSSPQAARLTKAARWSVARIAKASDGNVQFTRFASPDYREMTCPACGDEGRKEHALTSGGIKYFVCHGCGTHMAESLNPARSTNRRDDFSVKYNVYCDADVSGAVAAAIASLGNRPGGKFLDVGCGLGFSVDAVRRLSGWTAKGVEPGYLATYAKTWLGCDVLHDTVAGLSEDEARSFDVVFCADVLGRSPDPRAFLGDLMRWLKPDGTLFLTMPRADAIYELDNNAHIRALLSPGTQAMAPTEDGIKAFFRRLGLDEPAITGQTGDTVFKIACPSGPVALPSETAVDSYLTSCIDKPDGSLSFDEAAAMRGFIDHMDRGEGAQSESFRSAAMPVIEGAAAGIQAFEAERHLVKAFGGVAPCIGRFLYSEGMYNLNFAGDNGRAADAFALASRYARKSYALSNAFFGDQLELSESCDYHEVLSLKRLGKDAAAEERRAALLARGMGEHWGEMLRAL